MSSKRLKNRKGKKQKLASSIIRSIYITNMYGIVADS
jgi:hypothetical protein